jgi:hypothetical protein
MNHQMNRHKTRHQMNHHKTRQTRRVSHV